MVVQPRRVHGSRKHSVFHRSCYWAFKLKRTNLSWCTAALFMFGFVNSSLSGFHLSNGNREKATVSFF